MFLQGICDHKDVNAAAAGFCYSITQGSTFQKKFTCPTYKILHFWKQINSTDTSTGNLFSKMTNFISSVKVFSTKNNLPDQRFFICRMLPSSEICQALLTHLCPNNDGDNKFGLDYESATSSWWVIVYISYDLFICWCTNHWDWYRSGVVQIYLKPAVPDV